MKKIIVLCLLLLMHGQAYACKVLAWHNQTISVFFVSIEEAGTALYYYPLYSSCYGLGSPPGSPGKEFGDKVLVDDSLTEVKSEQVALADFDGDGDSDILLFDGNNAYIYYQLPDMEFEKNDITVFLSGCGEGGYSPETGDFNNDTWQDFLYVTPYQSGNIDRSLILATNNAGVFSCSVVYIEKDVWGYSASSGDFDEDGNLDFLEQIYPHGGNIEDIVS